MIMSNNNNYFFNKLKGVMVSINLIGYVTFINKCDQVVSNKFSRLAKFLIRVHIVVIYLDTLT